MVFETEEERLEFEQFKAAKAKKDAEKKRKELLATYSEMVNEQVEKFFPALSEVSKKIESVKANIFNEFKTIVELKKEGLNRGGKEDQFTHTFTNKEATKRITIGFRTVDNYLDTVQDGIQMVKDSLKKYINDDNSKALVNAVLGLLSKDQKGNLKPSRVLQLKKLATESGNDLMIEGVSIIEESYRPETSKTFVTASIKNEDGGWSVIPLNFTDVELPSNLNF